MRRLWINADDFGLGLGVSLGICDAMSLGAVGTTTAMVCVPGSHKVITRLAPRVQGRMGLHLQLTDGVPCAPLAEVPSLLAAADRFAQRPPLGEVEPREIEREFEAQLAALRALGIEPTHVDMHHHAHRNPRVFPVFAEFARRHGLPARSLDPRQRGELRALGVPTADYFLPWREKVDLESLISALAEAAPSCPDGGTTELMCHPGQVDPELAQRSIYVEPRGHELATLCDGRLVERLTAIGFVLAPLLGTKD